MMEIRLNLYQADRDFQVEIGGGGFGYRLFGPKFDGSSRLIKSVILSERDKEEIVRFVKPDAEAVERQLAMKQDDWLKECQENDRLRAALAAAQGEVEMMREVIEIMIQFIPDGCQMPLGWNQVVAQAQEALGGKP